MCYDISMSTQKKCKATWCENQVYASDVCRSHTNHLYRYGELRRFTHTPNEIIIKDKYAEIILYNRDMTDSGTRVKISKRSIPQVEKMRFYLSNGYAKVSSSKTKYLHQLISKCEFPLVCDHINRDKLDCRVENLRCVTRKENNLNK